MIQGRKNSSWPLAKLTAARPVAWSLAGRGGFPGKPAMSELSAFRNLIHGVRAGNEQAAGELVRQYETVVRRQLRWYMSDPKLYRLYDADDVCQMVLASFFIRAAAGQYDLDRPEQLANLLVSMTRNKIALLARKRRARPADRRRIEDSELEDKVVAKGPAPSTEIRIRELLQEVHQRLNQEERQLKALRDEGWSWDHIASCLGGTPAGRCKQLNRALNRVAHELGINDDDTG
jgi:RNA polymerase sigma-70 factor (ECF subfamily)